MAERLAKACQKIAVLVNAKAGGGNIQKHIMQAKREIWGWELEFFFLESIDQGRAFIEGLDAKQFYSIVIMGGDGTFNRLLPALIKSQIPCVPFPSGTANDFARELGITPHWSQMQTLFDQSKRAKIDVIDVNGIPFVTIAGTGVGALLTGEFNRKRGESRVFTLATKRLKTEVYSLLSAKTILLTRRYNHEVTIQSDQFSDKLKVSAVFICNQDILGGDIRVAPKGTKNDDERFNVLIIPQKNSFDLLKCLMNLKKGILTPDLISFSANRLKIESNTHKGVPVFGDGEILTESNVLNFQILPQALNVFRMNWRNS